MTAAPDFSQALCQHHDPLLFDLDAHHHNRLGPFNACWQCTDAGDVCFTCPIRKECLSWGKQIRSSGLIWGGMAFERGRPKPLRRVVRLW